MALTNPNGSVVTTYPDGTHNSTLEGPDPRWGMLRARTSTCDGDATQWAERTELTTRAVVLTDPQNVSAC